MGADCRAAITPLPCRCPTALRGTSPAPGPSPAPLCVCTPVCVCFHSCSVCAATRVNLCLLSGVPVSVSACAHPPTGTLLCVCQVCTQPCVRASAAPVCLSVCLCVPLCVYVHLCLSLCLTVSLCACEHLCAMVCARVHLCTCAFPCLSAQLCPCIPAGRGGVFGCVCSVCCAPTASAPQSLLCPSSVLGMVGHTPSSASPGVSPWGAACTGTPWDPHMSGNPLGSCGVTGCHGEPGPGMRCCGAMQCWMHPDQGCGHAMGQQELIQQSGGVRVLQGTAEWGPPSTGGLSRGGSSHSSATVLSCS